MTRATDGFTLAETLTATAIVAVGLLAAAAAFQYAISGIETGREETAATLLAEHKLEELKGFALLDWNHAALVPATTTEFCPVTGGGCTQTPTPGSYRRITTVAHRPGGTCATDCRMVRVTVFYKPVTHQGQLNQERRIEIITLFTART
jgi:prepilin-type N-terminal cleavage/methylation domain-containing protein